MIVVDTRRTNIVIGINVESKLIYFSDFETKSKKSRIQIK